MIRATIEVLYCSTSCRPVPKHTVAFSFTLHAYCRYNAWREAEWDVRC